MSQPDYVRLDIVPKIQSYTFGNGNSSDSNPSMILPVLEFQVDKFSMDFYSLLEPEHVHTKDASHAKSHLLPSELKRDRLSRPISFHPSYSIFPSYIAIAYISFYGVDPSRVLVELHYIPWEG